MKNVEKKYVVWSDWVMLGSKYKFFTARQVIKFYGLKEDECILCDRDDPGTYRNLDMIGKKAFFPVPEMVGKV